MAQVRLTPEVEQWLLQRTMDSGRSLAAEADVWLRKVAGLPPGSQSPAALAHKPQEHAAISAPTQGVRRFRGSW